MNNSWFLKVKQNYRKQNKDIPLDGWILHHFYVTFFFVFLPLNSEQMFDGSRKPCAEHNNPKLTHYILCNDKMKRLFSCAFSQERMKEKHLRHAYVCDLSFMLLLKIFQLKVTFVCMWHSTPTSLFTMLPVLWPWYQLQNFQNPCYSDLESTPGHGY